MDLDIKWTFIKPNYRSNLMMVFTIVKGHLYFGILTSASPNYDIISPLNGQLKLENDIRFDQIPIFYGWRNHRIIGWPQQPHWGNMWHCDVAMP